MTATESNLVLAGRMLMQKPKEEKVLGQKYVIIERDGIEYAELVHPVRSHDFVEVQPGENFVSAGFYRIEVGRHSRRNDGTRNYCSCGKWQISHSLGYDHRYIAEQHSEHASLSGADFISVEVWGLSTSLNLSSRPEDAAIIQNQLNS